MGSYHFSVESLYMTLDCPNISDFTLKGGIRHEGFFIQFENSTQLILYPNQTSYPTVEPWRVNFSALSNIASDNAFTANCTLARSRVESNVTCDDRSCSVIQIRRSLFDQRSPGWTPLNYRVSMSSMEHYWSISGGNNTDSGRSTLLSRTVQCILYRRRDSAVVLALRECLRSCSANVFPSSSIHIGNAALCHGTGQGMSQVTLHLSTTILQPLVRHPSTQPPLPSQP